MKIFGRTFTSVAMIGLCLGVYAFFVEPLWLEVNHYKVKAPVAPIKIAHLTDLHIFQMGKLERKVLKLVENESPDLIVITGDIFSEHSETQGIHEFLNGLSAPLGIWIVDGNWDYWTMPGAGLRTLATESKPVLLRNQNGRIRENLWIVGLDDAIAGNPDVGQAFRGVPEGDQCIALFHSPALFSEISGKCFLNLAGHTHGGQVRLPWLGPLWLPPGSGEYISGWYGTETSRLYVSKGIGTSILNIRFFARPEIAFFTVGDEI